ncbi:MAG: hypothetical protein NZ765_05490 [Anaerolineae bacterium]|nr:hypothetical protein [Anaerolineae bacterium]MDW8071915.1 hypothetical protein [Anaerolineae bacterium]
MKEQNPSDPVVLNSLERIVQLARRSWTDCGARAAFLGRWLRGRPTSGISRLRHLLIARHLLRRQQVYRNAGGCQSSAARYALARAAQKPNAANGIRH